MRVKRTYKLSEEAAATVKALAEERVVAETQDGVVEVAIRELARRLREAEDAEQWSRAASDPEFAVEVDRLATEFSSDDRAVWPAV